MIFDLQGIVWATVQGWLEAQHPVRGPEAGVVDVIAGAKIP